MSKLGTMFVHITCPMYKNKYTVLFFEITVSAIVNLLAPNLPFNICPVIIEGIPLGVSPSQ